MSLKLRQELERRIVTQFVQDAIAANKRLAVSLERGYDTDECLLGSQDLAKILDEAFAGDEAHIFVQPATGPTVDKDGMIVSEGWLYIVLGNDGYDVISDYTTNLETLLKNANLLANQYA